MVKTLEERAAEVANLEWIYKADTWMLYDTQKGLKKAGYEITLDNGSARRFVDDLVVLIADQADKIKELEKSGEGWKEEVDEYDCGGG